jgi:hypothetical protein
VTEVVGAELVLNIIGVAKLLGAAALMTPKLPRLEEWAYAGFVIDFVGGIWSHLAVQGVAGAVRLLLPLAILTVSYVSYRTLQRNAETAVAT